MKKKSVIISFVLSLALIMSAFSTVFAAAPPTDKTREEIVKAGVQCVQKIKNEVDAETIAKMLNDEVTEGKYKLMDTATLKKKIDSNEKIVIVDTMPEGWWSQRHIPGAICSIVGANESKDRFPIQPDEKDPLLKKVKEAVGTKTVTYYWNGKKWTTSKKVVKVCKKKGDKHYGKKKFNKEVVNKDATIVVYCGFVGCARSHQGAMFLKQNGFKNVYRYAGGISAWVDANYDIEGTDVE